MVKKSTAEIVVGVVIIVTVGIILWWALSESSSSSPPPPPEAPDSMSAKGAGPVDSSAQFPATGLLVTVDNSPELMSQFNCDTSVVRGINFFCTTQLLDTDWLIDRLNAEVGAAYIFNSAAKTRLRRRVFLTAAHCTRPLARMSDMNKTALKDLNGNGYFDLPDAYPFDDPNVDSVVGFNSDMGLSPGRVRFGDVVGTANCEVNLPSLRYTVQFNSAPGYPIYPLQTLGVGGIPPAGWQKTVIINDYMNVDTALMILKSPVGLTNAIVPTPALQRVYLSKGFKDPNKNVLNNFTVAGYGVYPAGDPSKGFLGNPAIGSPLPNSTISYRKVETNLDVTNIDGDGIHINWQLAQGELGTCGGDSGASALIFNTTDQRWYTYGDNSLGDGACRDSAYVKRIGTPNWREWVRRVFNSYLLYGLDDGAGHGSQHERILSSEEYSAQFGN